MFDVSMLDRCPPEPAAEPACRSCTILLFEDRPERRPVDLGGTLGLVCPACYRVVRRHVTSGLTLPAALAVTTWGTDDL
jgi:hypothetical protein